MGAKKKIIVKSTEDVLRILCESISTTLSMVTNSKVSYSKTFMRTNKTCLRPDIGCFVLFEGGFTGLVAMNFKAEAALEIYKKYNMQMGIPEDELTNNHASQEVADTIGELLNQCVGQFQINLKKELGLSVTQNQPRMVALTQSMKISLETEIDKPQFMRVEFRTHGNNLFYLETTFEKVDFLVERLPKPKESHDIDVDELLENREKSNEEKNTCKNVADEEFMKKLGL